MIVKPPRDGAPDFVKADVSFRAVEFATWLKDNMSPDGWVNVQIKEGKSGKWYAEKNGFKKAMPETKVDSEEDVASAIPF